MATYPTEIDSVNTLFVNKAFKWIAGRTSECLLFYYYKLLLINILLLQIIILLLRINNLSFGWLMDEWMHECIGGWMQEGRWSLWSIIVFNKSAA